MPTHLFNLTNGRFWIESPLNERSMRRLVTRAERTGTVDRLLMKLLRRSGIARQQLDGKKSTFLLYTPKTPGLHREAIIARQNLVLRAFGKKYLEAAARVRAAPHHNGRRQ